MIPGEQCFFGYIAPINQAYAEPNYAEPTRTARLPTRRLGPPKVPTYARPTRGYAQWKVVYVGAPQIKRCSGEDPEHEYNLHNDGQEMGRNVPAMGKM